MVAPYLGTEIGLIGCGRWGRLILRDLRSLGCSVHVVARSKASVARACEGGAASITREFGHLPDVAGVVVCTPTATHAEVTGEALSRGVPVYVEKPLTADVESAERLVDEGGELLFVMDKWRYHHGVRELARIARTKELGPVQSMHLRRVSNFNRHLDVDTVWTHAPHDLTIALEVLGELPPVHFAVAERMRGHRVGLVGTLGPPWVNLEISAVAPGHRREARLVCADGTAWLDGGWAEEVCVARTTAEGAEPERRVTSGELPLLAELRSFVEHVRGGPPPKSSAREGLEVVRRIAELGASADTREPAEVMT